MSNAKKASGRISIRLPWEYYTSLLELSKIEYDGALGYNTLARMYLTEVIKKKRKLIPFEEPKIDNFIEQQELFQGKPNANNNDKKRKRRVKSLRRNR